MLKLEIISDNIHNAQLIQQAITTKIQYLMLSLHKTEGILRGFEEKYQLSSDDFIQHYTAEDLSGGDIDYITWLGEIKLRARLQADLTALQTIEYVTE